MGIYILGQIMDFMFEDGLPIIFGTLLLFIIIITLVGVLIGGLIGYFLIGRRRKRAVIGAVIGLLISSLISISCCFLVFLPYSLVLFVGWLFS